MKINELNKKKDNNENLEVILKSCVSSLKI